MRVQLSELTQLSPYNRSNPAPGLIQGGRPASGRMRRAEGWQSHAAATLTGGGRLSGSGDTKLPGEIDFLPRAGAGAAFLSVITKQGSRGG